MSLEYFISHSNDFLYVFANILLVFLLIKFYLFSIKLHRKNKNPIQSNKLYLAKSRRLRKLTMQTPYEHDEEIEADEIEQIEQQAADLDPRNWLNPELLEQLAKDGIKMPEIDMDEFVKNMQQHKESLNQYNPFIEQQTRAPQVEESSKVNNKRSIKAEHKSYAAILHLSSLLFIMRIPFANVVLPAMLWLWKKDESKFIDFNGRQVINFQISLILIELVFSTFGLIMMYIIPSVPLKILQFTTPFRYMINSVIPLPVTLFTVVPFFIAVNCIIVGSIQAYRGIGFRYKFSYPFTEIKHIIDKAKAQQLKTT